MRFLVVLALLAIALVVEAPAWLLADRIDAATNGLIALSNASGTLWRGSADAYVPLSPSGTPPPGRAPGAVPSIALGRVAWHVDRLRPLERTAGLAFEQVPGGPRPIAVTVGPQGGAATGSVRLPAAVVQRWPQAAGWSAGGTIIVDTDALQWASDHVTGIATVSWRNATLQGPAAREPLDLGEVGMRVQFGPAGPAATLQNAGGSVAIDGNLDARGGQVVLHIVPRSGAAPGQLAWLESRLGPAPQGGYALRFTLPR